MSNDDLLGQLGDFLSKGTQNIRDRLTLDATDLLRAVDKNDPDEVARALRAGVDPNNTDGIRRRALPMATDNNHLLIVQLLLKAGAKPNLPGPYGDTPLFKAVYWENEEIVSVLLEAGADIHQPSGNGNSPLMEARKMGYTEIAHLLENYHEKARETQISKDRATHEELKEKAADARKAREQKALQEKLAAEKAQKEAAEKVLAEKYTVELGNYPKTLVEAIRSGDQQSAALLLEKIDDINTYIPEYRTTPLMAAIENKNTQFTQLLVEKGADLLTLVPDKQHSPLSLAVSMSAYKLVEWIIEKTSPEAVALSLNNPKQLLSPQFVAYKDPKMLHILLKAGADPYFGGQHGQAPVVKAIEKGSLAVLPVLVGNGVDLNDRYQQKTPLEWALKYNRTDWVGALLDEGVNPDTQDATGRTPLMLAVELNFLEAISLLLDEAIDLYLRDDQGRTAEELARERDDRKEALDLITSA